MNLKITISLVAISLVVFITLFPKYEQLDVRTRYVNFHGFTPVEHKLTNDTLEIVFQNQFTEPLFLNSIKANRKCEFNKTELKPMDNVTVYCYNVTTNTLSLDYVVGGLHIETSGQLP